MFSLVLEIDMAAFYDLEKDIYKDIMDKLEKAVSDMEVEQNRDGGGAITLRYLVDNEAFDSLDEERYLNILAGLNNPIYDLESPEEDIEFIARFIDASRFENPDWVNLAKENGWKWNGFQSKEDDCLNFILTNWDQCATDRERWFADQIVRKLSGSGYEYWKKRFKSWHGKDWTEGVAP